VTEDHRYELKFILDEASLSKAKSWLYAATTMRTSYPRRTINSVYFDDPGHSSVRDNLAGISERKKIRLRWYQFDKNSKEITSPLLEFKSRNGRLNRKNKLKIPGLEDGLLGLEYKDLFQQIYSKIGNSIFFDDHFSPALHVNYSREYFEDAKSVRITFDRQISFINPLPHTLVAQGTPISYPSIIMEVKFSPEHKLYVTSLLRTFNKSAVRHSKYLVGLATLGYASYI
jgi:hypothetical protein